MNGIINSNAMYGQVGQAIAADINNNQNAVIVGLKSSYSAMEMELRQAYQDFKGTTGESSDSAVLSEEVLIKAKSDIDKMKQTYQEQVKSFQTVYSSISDLISLSASKSDFNQVADATKKYAEEIIKKVNQFDSKQGNSANEDMIQSLGTQIKSAQKVGGLSYTDPRFLAFANSTALAENVQAFHKNVTEAEEKQRKIKEKDLNSMTPSEMIAKYGVDDPDVKKRINDINNGISTTVIGAAFDYNDQMEKYNDEARALKNTAAHTIIQSGGAAVGSQIGAWLGTAIPVPIVGTVVGAAVGMGIGVAVSGIYDWVESGQAKKSIEKKVKEVSKNINNVKEDMGKWFSNVGKSLGGAFD
ncbi:T7SS effector LXG polymorphic toxin [Enterococcus sp. UD-01]|uniref:T7SS effector LXG polymorphic toxin n=1 Tax=Enterococcus sp. UD-01 TaxID=3373911 RepID=UPI0038514A28